MPCSYAYTTACTRSRSRSLVSIRATCAFTVASLTYRRAAISAFDRPPEMRCSTSSSRSVRLATSGGVWACAGVRANSSITLRVMAGSSSASPEATARIACTSCSAGAFFSRNPLPSARNAYVYVGVDVERGEHNDPCRQRRGLEQLPGRLDPVQSRHPDVHERDVRSEPARCSDSIVPVTGLSDDFDVGPAARIMRKPGCRQARWRCGRCRRWPGRRRSWRRP